MRYTFYISLVVLSLYCIPSLGYATPSKDLLHYIGVNEGERSEEYEEKLDSLMEAYPKSGDTWEEHSNKMEALDYKYPGKIRVSVQDTEAPITLILASYSPTIWTLEIGPGVEIKKIYLSSYYKSSVVNADGITLETCFLVDDCEEYFAFDENDSDPRYIYDHATKKCTTMKIPEDYYQEGMKRIQEKFQRKPDSLQGAYEGKRFVVSNSTRGDLLNVKKESGHCYKNRQGILEPYDLEYEFAEDEDE